MRLLCVLATLFALPAASAHQLGVMCVMVNRHKDQLDRLGEKVAALPAPKLQTSRGYLCRMVPGSGCVMATQLALPVTVNAPGGGLATLDFTEGFPMTNRRAHLFYLHNTMHATADGTLIDEGTGQPRGHVRESGGRLYALITEPFVHRITVNDDPTVLHLTPRPERVTRAYVCVPNEAFE